MSDEPQVVEPVTSRWTEGRDISQRNEPEAPLNLVLFRLSGGLMRREGDVSERIDGLLTQMMAIPSSGRYSANADKNLDYLCTFLQLDFINSVAENSLRKGNRQPQQADVQKPSAPEG